MAFKIYVIKRNFEIYCMQIKIFQIVGRASYLLMYNALWCIIQNTIFDIENKIIFFRYKTNHNIFGKKRKKNPL